MRDQTSKYFSLSPLEPHRIRLQLFQKFFRSSQKATLTLARHQWLPHRCRDVIVTGKLATKPALKSSFGVKGSMAKTSELTLVYKTLCSEWTGNMGSHFLPFSPVPT